MALWYATFGKVSFYDYYHHLIITLSQLTSLIAPLEMPQNRLLPLNDHMMFPGLSFCLKLFYFNCKFGETTIRIFTFVTILCKSQWKRFKDQNILKSTQSQTYSRPCYFIDSPIKKLTPFSRCNVYSCLYWKTNHCWLWCLDCQLSCENSATTVSWCYGETSETHRWIRMCEYSYLWNVKLIFSSVRFS